MLKQKMGWIVSMAVLVMVPPVVLGGGDWRSGGSDEIFDAPPKNGSEFTWRSEKEGNIIFASDEFADRFPEMVWVNATKNRNVQKMIDYAWELRKIEKVLGKKDKRTTSRAMFEAAARLAVNQGNEGALKQIVALEPTCEKYMQDIKAMGGTRGASTVPNAMPEIVYPSFPIGAPGDKWQKRWEKAVEELEDNQVPFLRPPMLQFYFPDMDDQTASKICMLLNQGRFKNDPNLLVHAAVELDRQKGQADVTFLNPESVLGEAAELAISVHDKAGLRRVIQAYESEQFSLSSKAKMYGEVLKTMGSTRGASPLGDAGISAPELLSPAYRLEHKPAEGQK